MKLIIDMPKEKYEWIKAHNLNIDNNSIVGAIVNGTPITNGEFLLTLMQSVMTPEQLKEVLQKMTEDRYSEGYSDGYLDGSTGADWRYGAENE